jgi:hypothetical protein
MNLDREKGHSLDEFVQSMAEAIAWCSSRPRPWSPLVTFRSIDIAPEFGSNNHKSWIESVVRQREGIRVIPEECVGWLDVRCPHLVKSLAAQGIEFGKM